MSAIRPANVESIKYDGKQRRLVFQDAAASRALCDLGENIKLAAIRIRGAEFDGDILCRLLVDGKPGSGEGAVAQLVHYSISFVNSIVDMKWVIAARPVVTEMLYSMDIPVLGRWC